MQYGTTVKQCNAAIQRLSEVGMSAWQTGNGHHYLWVKSALAFPNDPAHCGRISVPNVGNFIAKFSALAA